MWHVKRPLTRQQSKASPRLTSKYSTFSAFRPITYHRLRYGHSLVQFDPVAEARLRMKIDLYIVPTVSLLYLFCFIDRANIGR
jgi:hypothetical protein